MDGYQKYVIDDDGVLHKVISMEIYFAGEEERAKFEKAMKEGRIKMVTLCKDCRKWIHSPNGNICEETGRIRCYDEFCKRGESR